MKSIRDITNYDAISLTNIEQLRDIITLALDDVISKNSSNDNIVSFDITKFSPTEYEFSISYSGTSYESTTIIINPEE